MRDLALSANDSPDLAHAQARRIVVHWLSSTAENTSRAYTRDLDQFRRAHGLASTEAAVLYLLGRGPGPGHECAAAWRTTMIRQGLASATIGRRLTTLRSLSRSARELGVVLWDLAVRGPKQKPVRDVSGPPAAEVATVIEHLAGSQEIDAARDLAIILLLHDSALRRAEVSGITVDGVDLAARTVAVVRKGYRDPQPWPVSQRCVRALARWLESRGMDPGPLFRTVSGGVGRPSPGFSPHAIRGMVARRSTAHGFAAWRPHGLRHSALTALVSITRDVELARRLGAHKSLATTTVYLDAVDNPAARAVAIVAGELGPDSEQDS